MSDQNEITLTAQGRFLKVAVCGGGGSAVRAKRSKVSVFSRASRLRLLQKMATIKEKGLKSVFVTLTYGQAFPSPREAKRHLDNLMKQLRRKHEKVSGFWRLEFQQRGAPHFHLLLFGLPFMEKGELAARWANIVGEAYWDYSRDEVQHPFTRIELLQSAKHASRYVAKYVGKVDTSEGGFNIASYLTDEGEFIHPLTGDNCGSIGRWWGVFNAENLPLADLVEIVVDGFGTFAVDVLRRALASVNWRVDPDSRHGFFLFEDNPYIWADYFEEMVQVTR